MSMKINHELPLPEILKAEYQMCIRDRKAAVNLQPQVEHLEKWAK